MAAVMIWVIIAGIALLVVLSVLALLAIQFAEGARQAQARIDTLDNAFTPWLNSITPGSSDYYIRMNEYEAAWVRWMRTQRPMPAPARWVEAWLLKRD